MDVLLFGLSTLVVFVGASVALIVSPGPDTVFVLTQGLEGGRRAGTAAALGTSTGIFVHTTAAVLGLSVLLRTSTAAFSAVRYVGAAYLVYLGAQTIRRTETFEFVARTDDARERTDDDGERTDDESSESREITRDETTRGAVGRDEFIRDETTHDGPTRDEAARGRTLREAYAMGATVNVLNPQVALFFLAFLPQFTDGSGNVPAQLFVLGSIYAVITFAYLGGVAALADGARRLLAESPRITVALRWLTGGVLVGFGVQLVFEGRFAG